MIQCENCGDFITMEEIAHVVVKEMDTPDKAYFLCDDCFNS